MLNCLILCNKDCTCKKRCSLLKVRKIGRKGPLKRISAHKIGHTGFMSFLCTKKEFIISKKC